MPRPVASAVAGAGAGAGAGAEAGAEAGADWAGRGAEAGAAGLQGAAAAAAEDFPQKGDNVSHVQTAPNMRLMQPIHIHRTVQQGSSITFVCLFFQFLWPPNILKLK